MHNLNAKKIKYLLALSNIQGIGNSNLKVILNLFQSDPEAVVNATDKELLRIDRIGKTLLQRIKKVRKEINNYEKKIISLENMGIEIVPYFSPTYPQRLLQCNDFPLYLFKKGNTDLNPLYSIAIVGTRNATELGKIHCQKIIESITPYKPLIVSGMALGIDGTAHKFALENQLETVGFMGHGLDIVYPKQHTELAKRILSQNGSLLSEYDVNQGPERGYFAERNRLIAGMVDAVIVVEAAIKGGAHITAELAIGYHRDVFAIPGRPEDIYSQGCNKLIKENKANLIEYGEDIADLLGWSMPNQKKAIQRSLLPDLNHEQSLIYELLLKQGNAIHIDELSYKTNLLPAKLSGILIEMEILGVVRSLPGKHFEYI